MKTALVAIIVFAAILLPCLVIRAGRNESRRLCTGRAWKTVAR